MADALAQVRHLRRGLEEEASQWVYALDLAEFAKIIGTSEARAVALATAAAQGAPAPARVALLTAARRKPAPPAKPRTLSEAGRARSARSLAKEFEEPPIRELLSIGGSESLICHALAGLERAGLTTVVIVVAYRGAEIVAHVREKFGGARALAIEFVDVGEDWQGTHAQSILQSREACRRHAGNGPVLVATSDHLFDVSLLRSVAFAPGGDAVLLVEDELHRQCRAGLLPATAVRVETRRRRDPGGLWPRIFHGKERSEPTFACRRVGRGIEPHDAFDAGLVRINDVVWSALEALEAERPHKYFALCDALDTAAQRRALSAVFTDGAPWLAVETDEQLEFTRVVVTSPRFRDLAPFELKIARKKSSDALKLSAPDEPQDFSPDADFVGDEEQPLTVIPKRSSFVAVPVCDVALDEAGVPRRRRAAERLRLARDVAPEHAAAIVSVDDESFVLIGDYTVVPPPTKVAQFQQAVLETTGMEPFDDVLTVELRLSPGATYAPGSPAPPRLEARVQHSVPVLGWFILVGATAAQASGALVLSGEGGAGTGATPSPLLLILWRMLGASLVAVPVAGLRARRVHKARGHAKPKKALSAAEVATVVFCTCCFLAGHAAFQIAVTAAAPDLLGDAVLFASLCPLVIVLLRGLGACGTPPTAGEIVGTALGLMGCAVCALAVQSGSPPKSVDAERNRDRVVLVAAMGCAAAFFHALKVVSSSHILSTGFNASYLHCVINVGSTAIAFAALALWEPHALGFFGGSLWDAHAGAFGLFAPTNILLYIWLAVGVDTCGTFGYTVSLQFVGPLVVTVAALLQPLCAVFEARVVRGEALPGFRYALGVVLLLGGGTLVAAASARTVENVPLTAAVKDRRQLRFDAVPEPGAWRGPKRADSDASAYSTFDAPPVGYGSSRPGV
ncbi:hypothetical protein M885DRAFT_612908 [Pelagophyceae sp. CCMP2097]|nr:hypothetical protein M885DRAFT_612908 [Pelagophyceae sp. CCMP2097]